MTHCLIKYSYKIHFIPISCRLLIQKTLPQQLEIRQKSRTDEHDTIKALQAFESKFINSRDSIENSLKTVIAFGLGFLLAIFITLVR